MKPRRWMLLALWALAGCGVEGGGDSAGAPGYGTVIDALTAMVEEERERWAIPAISIALVDDTTTVWAAGFGEEAPDRPASGETVYRVGSVSKLFTDIGVMQMVE